MKRAASVVVGMVVLGVVSASYAKPPAAPAPVVPPPAVKPPGKTVTIYYKPSPAGTDTTPLTNNKAGATLKCVTSSQPNKTYSVVIQDGKAYCKLLNTRTDTAPVICQGNGQLVIDDKLPATVPATPAKADMCLKASAPADAASSYVGAVCGTNSTGGGFSKVVKGGADTCEKRFDWLTLQMPGAEEGYSVVTCSTVVQFPTQPPKTPEATPGQIDARSVKCPAGSALEQEGNGVYCKKT